jgi:hypothetical protein
MEPLLPLYVAVDARPHGAGSNGARPVSEKLPPVPTGLKQHGRLQRQDCGCAHDGAQWIELCAEDDTKERALHARAMADHRGVTTDPDPWS